ELVPLAVLLDPAADEGARGGRAAGGDEIAEPGEAVQLDEELLARPRGGPERGRVADRPAGEVELAAEDRPAVLDVARPAHRQAPRQRRGRAACQRPSVEGRREEERGGAHALCPRSRRVLAA